MKMSDVRVGMILKSTVETSIFSPIIVTAITERGFKYSIPARHVFIARDGACFEQDDHEHYGIDGEALYEPA